MENKNQKKGGSKLKLIAIITTAILVIGAGGYFGYTMFLKDKGQTTKGNLRTNQQMVVQQQAGVAGQQPIQNGTYVQQPVVSAKTYGLDEFLVNLADESGNRYLKVKIFLGYDNKKLDAELEAKKPILRDAVISVLRTKKAADITPKGVEAIKMEIIQRINPILENGQINNVYINDILVQ